MIKWLLRRGIAKFERTWNYDASYLRDVLDADPRALMAFSKVTALGNYHRDVPAAVYCAAGIVGTRRRAGSTPKIARGWPSGRAADAGNCDCRSAGSSFDPWIGT